jgi:glycosyltransferase involved in cell wall biosynthesis
MKLLHTITSVDPKCGGPTESLRQLTYSLSNAGHYQEVVTVDESDKPWIRDFPVPTTVLGPRLTRYSYSYKIMPWLRSNVRRFDAVIVHGIWDYQSYAVWQVHCELGFPYFVFTHGGLSPWFSQTFALKRLIKLFYWPWRQYRILHDANSVLFTTHEEMLLARGSFRPYDVKETVAGYGVHRPHLDKQKQQEAFLGEYPVLRGKRFLLFLGRIHTVKGCDLLVRAFSTIARCNPDLHLVMAGPDTGGLVARLISLALSLNVAERIIWTGMLVDDLKWGAYLTAEAFILPSHSENFGIVVAEALACGKPVLISNKVSIWREIHEAGAGIVEEDTEEGVASMINKWLALTSTQKEIMSERAAMCFSRHFNLLDTMNSFIKVIESLTQLKPVQNKVQANHIA